MYVIERFEKIRLQTCNHVLLERNDKIDSIKIILFSFFFNKKKKNFAVVKVRMDKEVKDCEAIGTDEDSCEPIKTWCRIGIVVNVLEWVT